MTPVHNSKAADPKQSNKYVYFFGVFSKALFSFRLIDQNKDSPTQNSFNVFSYFFLKRVKRPSKNKDFSREAMLCAVKLSLISASMNSHVRALRSRAVSCF